MFVDLEERTAGVLWMQLHVAEFMSLELIDYPYAEILHALAPGPVLVALGDDHVAAVAAAALEKAAGGGVIPNRRHHLQQLIADGHQRILQTELSHPGVAVADIDPQYLGEFALGTLQPFGDQGDLAQA
ncbi:MAG: hypothetical protein U5Q16_00520 [Gammaproteobacteria bacterium]|nr:hypothetical protein [Gammaproteobacteria bacterium]